jgi:hypothetical protein
MALDRDAELNAIAEKVVQRLAAALQAGSPDLGYHCTGSVFKCGQYDCISAVHSCKDVYECNIKFTFANVAPR